MQITSIRPAPPGGKILARFDAETESGIRLYELQLTRGPNGLRVYGPRAENGAAVTFPPSIVDQLSALALEAIADGKTKSA